MDNVLMTVNTPLSTFEPSKFTAQDWRQYILDATLDEVSAIIEKGCRIRQFWEIYWLDRDKWGKDWNETCFKTIGLKQSTCSRYMHIYRVFSNKKHWLDSVGVLPADITCLDFIARAIIADEKLARQALIEHKIHPDMSKEEAGLICAKAQLEQETYIKTRLEEKAKDEEILEETGIDIKRLNNIRKKLFEAEADQAMEGPDVAREVKNPKHVPSIHDPVSTKVSLESQIVKPKQPEQELLPPLKEYPPTRLDSIMTPYMLVCRELDKLAQVHGFRMLCGMIEQWMEDKNANGDAE